MPTIDRTKYDELVRIKDELQRLSTADQPLIGLAVHAVLVARDAEIPVIYIDDSTVNGQPTPHIKNVYPRCPEGCKDMGKWGATGIMPPGHVLIRYENGFWVSHLREH